LATWVGSPAPASEKRSPPTGGMGCFRRESNAWLLWRQIDLMQSFRSFADTTPVLLTPILPEIMYWMTRPESDSSSRWDRLPTVDSMPTRRCTYNASLSSPAPIPSPHFPPPFCPSQGQCSLRPRLTPPRFVLVSLPVVVSLPRFTPHSPSARPCARFSATGSEPDSKTRTTCRRRPWRSGTHDVIVVKYAIRSHFGRLVRRLPLVKA
jgi:hypothetical protein